MCELTTATILAGIGVATAAGGAAYSANAQANAADAAKASNDAAITSQNRGFFARNADAQRQLAAQETAQKTSQTAQQSAFQAMRDQQSSALDARDQAIARENATAADIRSQADRVQQTLLDQTSGQALSDAQAGDASRREQAMAPAALNIQETSPLGTPNQGGATSQAYASRIAEAAGSVRDYGKRLAQVSSYTAPLTTVGQAISQQQAGIMPAAAANQLLQSGQGVRLLPSKTAYDIAGSEGAAKQTQIASALQGDLGVAKSEYEGSENVANLQQGNTDTIAKNTAVQAQMDAAQQQAIGGLVAQVGGISAYAAGRYGDTINGYFTKPTGTITPQPVAPPIVAGTPRIT